MGVYWSTCKTHNNKSRAKKSLEEVEGMIYGRAVEKLDNGWGDIIPGMYVRSLFQDHVKVAVPGELIEQYKIGDVICALPVHSCMTGNSMKSYRTLDGEWIGRLG